MTNYKRAGAKWTINECLRLQREFELLKLSIDEIASLHQRSPQAIMYKLDAERLADYNVLAVSRTNSHYNSNVDESHDVDEQDCCDNDNDDDNDSSSDYEEDQDCDDAASEISDEEISDEEVSDNEEYDRFNIAQQVRMLTKQMSVLSEFVFKTLKNRNGRDILKFEDLAGCR